MKKFLGPSILIAITCLSIFVPSCTKEKAAPTLKTVTFFSAKDASISNGTTLYDVDGVDGEYNDFGSGGSDLLRVGYSDNQYSLLRTLIAFDVTSIPANAKIISVTLNLTIARNGSKPPAVFVHKLTEGWTEGTTREDPTVSCTWDTHYCEAPGVALTSGVDVTWSHAKYNTTPWSTPGGVFVSTASATASNGGTPVFSSDGLISDVKAWIATPASNFGWLLKVDEANLDGGGGEQIRYCGKEAADNGAPADTKPKLVIVYQQ